MQRIKSSKSFKSLLGLNKESAVEKPMIDVTVDIGMEASRFDAFDFQSHDEVQNDHMSSNVETGGKLKTSLIFYDLLIYIYSDEFFWSTNGNLVKTNYKLQETMEG
jgi:hypothetical protein